MVRVSDTEELNRKAEAYKLQLSDSFNSTTFKILLGWKEDIESALLKIEKQISSWGLQISLKVQRDIRTTLAAGDFLSRQASKSVEAVVSSVEDIQRPLSSLPERVKDVVTRSDSWDLLGQGIDPTEKSSLIGNFDSVTTKQRAEKIKKKRLSLPDVKVPGVGVADSLYRSVRLLPSKLQYDYQRRQVQKELAGAGKGAGFMVRGLPAEGVPVPAAPLSIPALSDGRDDSTWLQQQVSYKDEEDLDFREGLDEKPRFIEVVDEDGRVTTLQATSFDMESSGDDDDEVEEEMMLKPAATLVEDLTSAAAAVYRLTDGCTGWTDLPVNSWAISTAGEADASAIVWLRSLLVDAKSVVSQRGVATASARREGEVEFSVALQQLNATLTQLEAAVRSCDRISSLGTAVGLSAVEADTPNEAGLSKEDVTLTLSAMWAIERITTIPNGVSSEGFLRQTGLLESVSLSANGTVQRARWVELTNVLQAIQKGLALEKERTLTSLWDSPLQGHAASELDLVAAERIEEESEKESATSETAVWSPGALMKTPPAPTVKLTAKKVSESATTVSTAPEKPVVFTLSASSLREAFDLSMITYQVKKKAVKKAKKTLEAVASSDATLTEEAVVVDTTAVLTATKEAKLIGFLITSLDVTLFLLESLLKAVVPILKDGGSLALSRATETIEGWGALSPTFKFTFSSNSKWKIYEQFKNSEIYYANE